MKRIGAVRRRRSVLGDILLTGAAGFVGSHLADRLLAEGYRIIGVDNLSTGSLENLAHLDNEPYFDFIERDACQPLPSLPRLKWVMHFASPASPPKYLAHPIDTLLVNSHATHRLLDVARSHGAAFMLASTSESYGDPQQHPQPESYWGNVNPVGPRSVYDEGKRYAESMSMAYHRAYGLPVRIIRIFNTYGPRMDLHDGRVVTNFIRQCLFGEPLTIYGDGTQTRSLQYIDDLVDGIVRYMAVDFPGPLNLGNPSEYQVLEIARMVRAAAGSQAPITHHEMPENDPLRRRPDIALARELLNWEPRVAFGDGLRRTLDDAVHRLSDSDGLLRVAQ